MVPKKARRAAVYVRISQDRNGEHLGTTRQRDDCRDLCDRQGWTVAEVYEDNEASAYSGRARPGYTRMMADVAAGIVDAVVAYRPDRLYRRLSDLAAFVEVVKEAKAAVATVQGGDVDLTTAEGRALAGVLGVMSAREAEVMAERVVRAQRQAREAGRTTGGRRAFGYRANGELDPVEAPLVAEAYKRLLSGESLYSISKEWGARGIRTPQDRPWQGSTLSKALVKAKYAGLVETNGTLVYTATGEPVRGQWEPIVTVDQWEAVRALLKREKVRGKPGRPGSHLLSGLVVCGRCGRKMSVSYAYNEQAARMRSEASNYGLLPKDEGQANEQQKDPDQEALPRGQRIYGCTRGYQIHDADNGIKGCGLNVKAGALESEVVLRTFGGVRELWLPKAEMAALHAAWGEQMREQPVEVVNPLVDVAELRARWSTDGGVDVEAIRSELRGVEARLAELGEMIAAGTMDPIVAQTASRGLSERARRLRDELGNAAPDRPSALLDPFDAVATDDVRAIFEEWPVDRRREFLGAVLKPIRVHPSKPRKPRVFDHSRVEVAAR